MSPPSAYPVENGDFILGDTTEVTVTRHLSDQTWLTLTVLRPDLMEMFVHDVCRDAVDIAWKRERKPASYPGCPAVETLPRGVVRLRWTIDTIPATSCRGS